MTPAARERLRVRVPVLCGSAVAWILLLAAPGGAGLHAHCSPASLDLLLAHNPPAALALGWVLMLVAMMGPSLIAPVRHVRDRSFARRRARAVALFVAGYVSIWLAAGAVLLALALAGRLVAPESLVPVALVALVALVWQASPAKQICLNRCHAHAELPAFAPAADVAALRFGLTHGIWCAGSCWALMLLPLLVSRGHLAVMAAVTLWLLAERLERPAPPGWRWRGPGKAVRLVAAQSRLRLQRSAGHPAR